MSLKREIEAEKHNVINCKQLTNLLTDAFLIYEH